MRDFTGIPYASLPSADHPDFMPRVRNMFSAIDYFLKDMSKGVARIQKGEIPSGSGASLSTVIDLTDYLFLPGRVGGQTIQSKDVGPTVIIKSDDSGLAVQGSIGKPGLRLSAGSTSILDLRPYNFGGIIEPAFTDSAGVGVGVNFPSQDGTSAMRIASTTNRSFLQAGLKMSNGNIQNARLTIGGAGATVGLRLNSEFQYIGISNSGTTGEAGAAVVANTTRLGVGADTFDFSGSSIANSPDALYLAPLAGGSNAPLTIQAGTNAIEIRNAPTGSSPNKVLGGLNWTLGSTSPLAATWYSSGTKHFYLTNTAVSDFSFIGGGASLNSILRSRIVTGFADAVLLSLFELGDAGSGADSPSTLTSRRAAISSSGGNVFSRLAILSTSTILGPATSPAAPASSRILTVVNSAATVLSGIDSTGGFFSTFGTNTNNFGATIVTSGDTTGIYDGAGFVLFDGQSFHTQLETSASLAADITLNLPATSGSLVGTAETATLGAKTLGINCRIRCGTSAADSLGIRLLRGASTTLYHTLNVAALTAAREITTQDDAGGLGIIVAPSSATTDKTGQTVSLGATTVYTTTHAGLYRLSAYLVFTAVTGAGNITITALWTDPQQAQTNAIVNAVAYAAAGNYFQAETVMRCTSGSVIQYSTTQTGTGTWNIYVRVESLT